MLPLTGYLLTSSRTLEPEDFAVRGERQTVRSVSNTAWLTFLLLSRVPLLGEASRPGDRDFAYPIFCRLPREPSEAFLLSHGRSVVTKLLERLVSGNAG